jgi:tRNA(fMet)-specific endonuclease VapC
MNKTLLDTDISSEILRAVNPVVVANARSYRQTHGVLTLSVITVMEMVKAFQQVQRPQKITDLLTYYQNRQAISIQGEPLSETVIRERR